MNEVKMSMSGRESGKGKGEASNLEAPWTSWRECGRAKGEANKVPRASGCESGKLKGEVNGVACCEGKETRDSVQQGYTRRLCSGGMRSECQSEVIEVTVVAH